MFHHLHDHGYSERIHLFHDHTYTAHNQEIHMFPEGWNNEMADHELQMFPECSDNIMASAFYYEGEDQTQAVLMQVDIDMDENVDLIIYLFKQNKMVHFVNVPSNYL